jgi:hypothetical protein
LKDFSFECPTPPTDLVCPIDKSAMPAFSFHPLNDYLSEAACDEKIFQWSLTDARYNCLPLIETCNNIPCTGVNEDFLKSQIIKTDCEIELYALSCCLFLLVFFYHAIVVNLVCTFLFKGIRQVLWRKLCPFGIRLRTRLHEDGNLAKGKEKSNRSERISLAIKRFELLGWLQITLGALSLIGWAISVLALTV